MLGTHASAATGADAADIGDRQQPVVTGGPVGTACKIPACGVVRAGIGRARSRLSEGARFAPCK
jgi:hypothetical protein